MTATIGEVLGDSKTLVQFKEGLPPSMPKLLSQLQEWCQHKEGFSRCTLSSVLHCVERAEAMGLGVGGILSDTVLEPCGKVGDYTSNVALLIPTVRGLMRLVLPEDFRHLPCGVVRQGDHFVCGSEIDHKHKPNGTSGSIVAVYFDSTAMTKRQVEEVRNLSRVKNGDSWEKNWTETALRTCLRRAVKFWVLEPKAVAFIEELDQFEFGDLKERFRSGEIQSLPPEPPPPQQQEPLRGQMGVRQEQTQLNVPMQVARNDEFTTADDQAMTTPQATGPGIDPTTVRRIMATFWGTFEKVTGKGRDERSDLDAKIGFRSIDMCIEKTFGKNFGIPDGETFAPFKKRIEAMSEAQGQEFIQRLSDEEKLTAVIQHKYQLEATRSAKSAGTSMPF